jgi:hypothetical protein
MLVSAASSLLVVLASVPHVSAQAVSTTTSISTVTLPPGPTAAGGGAGDTMATVDVNGRIQFITQLTYNSLKDLSSHKIIAPNASSWFICSSTNAVMLDTPVPSTDTKKNGTTLAFMISAANKSESMLGGTMYPINSAYAGHTTTVFNWTDGTCVPGGGYFLAAVDKNCVENVDTPIQGCEYITLLGP